MIDVFRLIENQAAMYGFSATRDPDLALDLENLIDNTKPKNLSDPFDEWHPLIATPFRYPVPTPSKYAARFRPPYSMQNVFYCSSTMHTAMYEHSYHFLRERIHLTVMDWGRRTAFSVSFDETGAIDVRTFKEAPAVLHPQDYHPSHQFVENLKNPHSILYPSVRDPEHRINYAVFQIKLLAKRPCQKYEKQFSFNPSKKAITWIDEKIEIAWSEVFEKTH